MPAPFPTWGPILTYYQGPVLVAPEAKLADERYVLWGPGKIGQLLEAPHCSPSGAPLHRVWGGAGWVGQGIKFMPHPILVQTLTIFSPLLFLSSFLLESS